MKHLLILTCMLIAAAFVSSAQTQQKASTKATEVKLETAVVKVPTIVCSSCVNNIMKALRKVDGVKSTKVDLKTKTATVSYASAKTSLPKIERAIANAGYDANSTKRDPKAYDKLDACCKADAKE
ncbi:MAG TPA: heavy metal-associated domain-containing protein [Bacteroidota bacterium]|nr:heavy metal-associated domain-containing protein [Bacteroidota bacterium]